ncbi:lysosome-associated membrane glycoprotein 3 [Dugong dugon]
MSWQFPAVVVLFVSLAVILHYSSQLRDKAFPEASDDLQPTAPATAQARPSPPQPTSQVPHKTLTVSLTDGRTASQTAATTSKSDSPTTHTMIKTPTTTASVTTESLPPTSPITHSLVTTQATPSVSQSAPPVTEATIGPSAAPHSRSPPVTPPAHTTLTHPSTLSHTAEKTNQPSNQTSHPATLSTAPGNSTTTQMPSQPTHAPGTTTATHNVTQTAPPAPPGPTLAPQPSSAKTGIYQVLNGSRLCIKAELGIELIVQDEESVFSPQRYFNINPNATQASGNCGPRKSNLLLNFQGGFVNFTFTKDENSYSISEVGAYLTDSNPERIYQGTKSAMVWFETMAGHSFKCVSEQSIKLSPHLQLKTVNVQLQAFDFEGDHFGNADACFSDRSRREIPVAVGLSITGLFVILLTACLVASKRPSRGYERM